MAATLVGGALLGAAFNVLLDRLTSPELINFFRGRKYDQSLLKKLEVTLLELNKVLNDAEDRQITDRAVKAWLDELKDAVYHAEDLVDEMATEALRSKVEVEYPGGKKRLSGARWKPNFTGLFGRGKNPKLEEMIGTLDRFLVKAKDVLRLREVAGRNWYQTRLPSTSLVAESEVYGRETAREEIMKLLLSDGESSNKVDVIPIVGMGGVGKTTLAQLLYNDGRLFGHFAEKAWVCVSDVFDVERVTRTIVVAITGSASDAEDLNSLQVELKESLNGKKFLIVLDDVWNENYNNWNALMAPFRFGAHGSKIVVTTRNEGVASTMRTVPTQGLQELSEEDCWKLFSKHAFEKGDFNAHPNLEKIGKEIVKKCKGLPLAAKTLGGLLRSQRDVKDWNNILESAIWELPEEKSNILPALRLSYHYLPSHLKRCFAFCSIFIKDYGFDMKELVSIWIAEGFLVKPKNNKTMDEEGYEWFHELLSRSFFQRSNDDNSLFVMHDLIHDLAQYVMGDFYYRLEDGKAPNISDKVRHFSFVHGKHYGSEKFKGIRGSNCLRTFLPLKHRYCGRRRLSEKVVDEILPRLTRLRLLSVSKYEIEELPHSIGNLKHLRSLDLSYTRIKELPGSVCTLYNLETLSLSNCDLLITLPADLGKLISLRHLDLWGTNLKEMPKSIARLKDLQQLSIFVVGTCTGINELGEFHCLRGTISISGLQNVKSGNDATEAKMSEKQYLEKLALEWNSIARDSQNARDVLEKLKPHTNLKHLEIQNYRGTTFPTWLGDQLFCNIVLLQLKDCKNCLSLPPLGQLPSLKELTIARMPGIRNVGQEFYRKSGSSSKPFPSLETLRFENMSRWVDWCILDAGEFSQLQKLEVINCPKLIGHLPTKVPSLVELEIRSCPELVASLPNTTSIRKLELQECQGMQLQWQCVSSVENLTISGFASWEEFKSEMATLTNLKDLSVSKCPRLYFPSDEMSHRYMFLEKLILRGCGSLKSIPLGLFPKLQSLEIRDCTNFETLIIEGCENMSSFPGGGLTAPNLSFLQLVGCEKLKGLPEQMHTLLPSLHSLVLISCPEIESFPEGGLPSKLGYLDITNCKKLKALPEQMHTLPSLQGLYLQDCPEIESFPEGGLPSKLGYLDITNCKKLKALPEQMHTLLPSLQGLYLQDCPEIESFQEGGLPSKLGYLGIWNCKKLVGGRRDWGLQTLPSLTRFTLQGEDVLESFPEEGLLPSTLTDLRFGRMPNLKSLNKRGLQHLGSLEHMYIYKCPKLQSFSVERLPTSLLRLEIEDCPLLKPRCRREEEEDWHKISHIPYVRIDGEEITD